MVQLGDAGMCGYRNARSDHYPVGDRSSRRAVHDRKNRRRSAPDISQATRLAARSRPIDPKPVMKLTYKIYIVLAAVVLIAIVSSAAISHIRISRLESAVETAKHAAEIKETEAAEQEKRTAEYKEKIDYLERKIGENQSKARNKDEDIKKANTDTRDARPPGPASRGPRSTGN